jgi:hypothetical protein
MPTPKQKRIIVLQSSNHASEFHSLRDAVADSQDESTESGGNDLTGDDYSEASPYDTIPTGNGNDGFRSTFGIINTGNGDDFLIGGYSELRPISEIITFPPERPKPSPAFTDSIDGEISFQFVGFPGLSAIGRSQEAVSKFSGVSSVEATLLLPSLQKVREAAHRRLNNFITGGNGNDSLF